MYCNILYKKNNSPYLKKNKTNPNTNFYSISLFELSVNFKIALKRLLAKKT